MKADNFFDILFMVLFLVLIATAILFMVQMQADVINSVPHDVFIDPASH